MTTPCTRSVDGWLTGLSLLMLAQACKGQSGGPFTGYGTYSQGQDGVCSTGGQLSSYLASGMQAIAINAAQANGGAACGSCVQVTASGAGAGQNPYPPSFTAVVSNICPTCGYGGLDLPSNEDGSWEISWEFVACPGSATGGRKMLSLN